jgi:hypothetical protein
MDSLCWVINFFVKEYCDIVMNILDNLLAIMKIWAL